MKDECVNDAFTGGFVFILPPSAFILRRGYG